MRIMGASACKRDATEIGLFPQRNPENPRGVTGFDLGNCP
jgi:hypothetical protein